MNRQFSNQATKAEVDSLLPKAAALIPRSLEYAPLEETRFSQSLDRGLAILSSFTPERHSIGISELAERLQMSRSTTHRYVMTLLELGYLQRNSSGRKYQLSLRVTSLGMSTMSSICMREHAYPDLKRLFRETGLTASLAVLDGQSVFYLEQVHGPHQSHLDPRMDPRRPAYCTALGKVLLAHLPEDERRGLIGRMNLAKRTANTIKSKRLLQAELEQVLGDGVAADDQESAPGVLAIAAPVRLGGGETHAAIDLLASTSEITIDQLILSFGPHVISAANRISARLGHRRTPLS
jgi:IclR family pca regulon transcriptional regulator